MPSTEKRFSRTRRVALPAVAAGASVAAAIAPTGAAATSAAVQPTVSQDEPLYVVGPAVHRFSHPWARTAPTLASSSTQAPGTTTYSIPASIVMCESGGNWRAVNPSTGAGGAYQILPSTWTAYGGHGLPQDASPAEQSAIAAKIYATVGRSAWSC